MHLGPRVLAHHLLAAEPYVELTRLLFRSIGDGGPRAQSSTLALYQLLVEPYRRGEPELAERTGRYLTALRGLEWIPVDAELAGQAARVRAELGGSLERAVHIATALRVGVDLYLTEGSGLKRVAGMEVLDAADFATA